MGRGSETQLQLSGTLNQIACKELTLSNVLFLGCDNCAHNFSRCEFHTRLSNISRKITFFNFHQNFFLFVINYFKILIVRFLKLNAWLFG